MVVIAQVAQMFSLGPRSFSTDYLPVPIKPCVPICCGRAILDQECQSQITTDLLSSNMQNQ